MKNNMSIVKPVGKGLVGTTLVAVPSAALAVTLENQTEINKTNEGLQEAKGQIETIGVIQQQATNEIYSLSPQLTELQARQITTDKKINELDSKTEKRIDQLQSNVTGLLEVAESNITDSIENSTNLKQLLIDIKTDNDDVLNMFSELLNKYRAIDEERNKANDWKLQTTEEINSDKFGRIISMLEQLTKENQTKENKYNWCITTKIQKDESTVDYQYIYEYQIKQCKQEAGIE